MAEISGSNRIWWLASYPKSGNTWMRVLLSQYQAGDQEIVDINRLAAPNVLNYRSLLEAHLGVESTDLTPDEIERLRPMIYMRLAAQASEPYLWKTHDAWRYTDSGELLFPPLACGGCVYVVRNPLDVAVSFANHLGWELEQAVIAMADTQFCLSGSAISASTQIRELLGSWSEHVSSWIDQDELPVVVVRYEDLHDDTEDVLVRVLRHLGWPLDLERVARAVDWSRFDKLQAQELQRGYAAKSATGGQFFRRGIVGAWRDELSAGLVRRIQADHGAVMRRLGY